METQKIQATITLNLTAAQLLTLLQNQTAQPPAPQQTLPNPNYIPAGQPMPQMTAPTPAAQPQNPAQMFPAMQSTPAVTPAVQGAPMPSMMPTAQSAPQTAPTQMPAQTSPQTYTVEQLGLAARPLMESGRREELTALLTEFGVQSVAHIPEDRRADFAARLRAMGGQI